MDDVWVTLSDGITDKRIGITTLALLEPRIRNEFHNALTRVAHYMLMQLRDGYAELIRTSHRKKGEALRSKLQRALVMTINTPMDSIWMGVFDLALMDRLTRHEGFRTDYRGWFMLYEDGHTGLRHGSRNWDFVELEEAKELAEKCIQQLNIPGDEAAVFRNEVSRNFQGRHGDGIMVNLHKPLFFKYPQFGARTGETIGKAGNIIGSNGHPGFQAWNLLDKVGGGYSYRRGATQRPEDRLIFNELDKALAKVFKEL